MIHDLRKVFCHNVRICTCLQLPAICTENLKIKKSEINKSIENKSIETKAYVTPWICLPVKNQPLNLTKKHFEKFNMNFADQGYLGDEIDLLICSWQKKVQQLHGFRNLVMLESVFWMDS